MRRGTNIRKRKRIISRNINTKSLKLLTLLIVFLVITIFIYIFFLRNTLINKNFTEENLDFSILNENIPFSLRKIILFSSVTATGNNVNHSVLSLDISQYCDIGIYINNNDNENTCIKSLYIDNIVISSPELGTPCLYKKVVSDLGKCSFVEDSIINDRFDFNVISKDSQINYTNYEIFNDASTPISLGFYNKNIKENFLTDNTEILYNGTLLKDALISTNSLNCNISFTINIITTSDEQYLCNINFDVPLEENGESLYDIGHITKEISNDEMYRFIRIK